jgi:hypothetical protein
MSLRRALLCCTLALPSACADKKGAKSVPVEDAAAAPAGPVIATAPPEPVHKVHVRASIEGVDDMLTWVEGITKKTNPDQPLDIRAQMQADLLQSGFGPGFYESLDLSGMFALDLGWPFPEVGQAPARAEDWEIAGIIPTVNARRLVDSMPDTNKPQPLSGGLWELIDGELSIKLRESGQTLEFGREIADLDRAAKLPAEIGSGRRVRVRAWDLPAEWLDASPWLGTNPGPALAPVAEVMAGTQELQLEAEMGTDRDVVALVAAQAPFSKLGLDPIGAPATKESAIASMLPPQPAFAMQMPWGEPALLHRLLDENVNPSQVPAPFDQVISDAIAGVHGLLDQLRDETLTAFYVDAKGRATYVMAARVADDAKSLEHVRTLMGAAEKAFKAHIALQGDEKDKRYTVSIKQGVKLGRAKADRFTVTVPGFLKKDVEPLAMFVGKKKPKLEAYAMVQDGMALVAFGAGAKAFMTDVGKQLGRSRSKSLEADGGLALARTIDGGCQFCVAIDPLMAARLYFVAKRDGGKNEKAGPALKKLAKIRIEGQFAFAVTLADTRGSLGFAFPRELIDGNPKGSRALNDLIQEVDQAEAPGDVWDGLGAGAAP